MTQVIIKQLTGCMSASPYNCHSFSICLLLCLPLALSHLVQPSACMYGVCVVTVMPCTAQRCSINIPTLQLQRRAQGTLRPRSSWHTRETRTSSSSSHTADSNPLSELLQKTTYYDARGVMTANSQCTMLALYAQPLLPRGCTVNK